MLLYARLALISSVSVVFACGSTPSTTEPLDAGAFDAASSDASASSDAGSKDTGLNDAGPNDAAPTLDAADPGLFAGLRLGNDLCMPQPLPTAPSGLSTCHIILGVPGSCSGGAGLSPANAADRARVQAAFEDADASVPAGSLCVLNQLPASSSPGAGCSNEQSPGWCYAAHSACPNDAGVTCKQSACVTDGYETDVREAGAIWGAWLSCP